MTPSVFALILAVMSPCPTEDSDNCAWNAQVHGNGQGRSFAVLDSVILYNDDTCPAANAFIKRLEIHKPNQSLRIARYVAVICGNQ